MLLTVNSLRPMTVDNSLTVRYICTDCSQWCTVIYDYTQIIWDDGTGNEKVDLDRSTDEEIYFVDNAKAK